ncbi:MAG: alkaline phosphatase family protein [Planctomycetota bacterium]
MKKRVLLLIVDGLSWRVIGPAIQAGEFPTLCRLAERGLLAPCTSIFPSITPAATASIVTGHHPRRHGIQGAFWRDESDERVSYFGDSFRVAAREGLADYVSDYLRTMNDELLRVPTLFETVQRSGGKAASLNLMWRRGLTKHRLAESITAKLMPGLDPGGTVFGPDFLFLGEFARSTIDEKTVPIPAGLQNRFGFNDDASMAELAALAGVADTPELIVAYFPNNDFRSHDIGPEQAKSVVLAFDHGLEAISKAAGGFDDWLEETAVVIVGDHGHDELVKDKARREVDLAHVFRDKQLTPAGSNWQDGDELMICPNMRAVQINCQPEQRDCQEFVIDRMLSDERVDQVIVPAGAGRWRVCTRDRGELLFADTDYGAGMPNTARTVTDPGGEAWLVDGSLQAVAASVNADDEITYADYPDALSRIALGAPGCQSSLWATAKPGFEFVMPGISGHEAGSHGSLHALDSQSVLVAAGFDSANLSHGECCSITDVANLCCSVLNLG